MATQSSSHNWPIDISVPLFKLEKLYAIFAFRENASERGRDARLVGVIIRPSATLTYGPIVFSILLHKGSISSVI